jgi:Abnormal spindle-like microcephaly-assoc'd, ASPM-SPD-2-Hydin
MSLSPRRSLALALPAALALLALSVPSACARLSAQPSAQEFGIVGVDQGGQSVPIAIVNSGATGAQLGAATLDGRDAGAFRIDWDGCNGQLLAPGQGCTVQVGFTPSQMLGYAATLHVPSDDGDLPVALTGTGGVQQAAPSPALVDFGDADVGGGTTRSVTIRNTGNLPYQTIVAIPNRGDVGSFRVVRDGCSLEQVAPGDGCVLDVRFAPTAPGLAQATLTVINGSGAPVLVSLRGSGRQGIPVIAPSAGDFGTQASGGAGSERSFTVVDAGDGALPIAAVSIAGPDAEQFRVVGEDCTSAPLVPAGACTVRVRFAPGAAGAFAASLRIVAGGVATVQLAGRSASAVPMPRGIAGIAFERPAGSPAPFAHGRIDLGVVRCAPARVRCRVTVRARVYALGARASHVSGAGWTARWRPGSGAHVGLALPAGLRGTPALLVARLRTSAAGRRSSTRMLVASLVRSGRRRSPLATARR